MKRTSVVPVVLALALAAGCGGDGESSTPSVPRTTADAAAPDPTAELKRAAVEAMEANTRLSQQVGWTNRVPASATRSTRGAALANMRYSAAENARAGLRVRTLSARVSVASVRVSPSYGDATVVASAEQRVRVHRRGRGKPRERVVAERARIDLRRVGREEPPRFVVWRVSVLR